jgi:hypothetical protein
MNITEKFEQIDCRKDEKARRVSNVAPRTLANITADTIENGVTLEALEALNVPVLRYATQVTIHGKLPEFSEYARPGGYKSIVRNGNGSIGVRYCAIDAEKKALMVRACRVAGKWSAEITLQGLQISQGFRVRDETAREQKKAETIAALRSLPTELFFGQAFAYTMPYGAGYGAAAYIGAIPLENLWLLIENLTGCQDIASVEFLESLEEAKRQERMELNRVENEAREAEAETKAQELIESLAPYVLTKEPKQPGDKFRLLNSFNELVTVELSGKSGRMFYKIQNRWGDSKRHLYIKGWDNALQKGRLFAMAS